jgi:hypothetical protein
MFSTKGQEVKTGGGTAKSLQAGVVYAHIYSGQVRTSNKGDKKTLELVLEGPASEGFEGWAIDKNNPEGAKFTGQSSRVSGTIWTDQFNDSNVTKNELMFKLAVIASELGLRDQVDNISASSIEDWVEKAINILKGHNLYWFLKGTEEEYNGKTIIKLSLPKYKFVSTEEAKLDKFDKNNQYHYKALQNKPVSSFEPVNSDFDM